MNKSLQKEECCPECSTPASGASDETQKECLNKDCKYCHIYSMITEQTIREEERAKCRALMEGCKGEIEKKKHKGDVNEYWCSCGSIIGICKVNSTISTCISILEDKLKELK